MKTIVKILCSSRLFGTHTKASGYDYKGIHLPAVGDILTQRTKTLVQVQPGYESFSLSGYLSLVVDGHATAVEMLFAPESNINPGSTDEWAILRNNVDRLLSKNAENVINFCTASLAKYNPDPQVKIALQRASQVFKELEEAYPNTRIVDHEDVVEQRLGSVDGIKIYTTTQAKQIRPLKHIEINGKKLPFTFSLKDGIAVFDRADLRYRGIDTKDATIWKTLSTVVRITKQMTDLHRSGEIRFPLPYAGQILDIKQGVVSYDTMYKTAADSYTELLDAVENSVLPEEPDNYWIDTYIKAAYYKYIRDATPEQIFG